MRYDDGFGHEQGVGRPVLIVTSNKGIETADTVMVAFLTSRYKQINVNVEISCMPRRSWVLCNQIRTVDKRVLSDLQAKVSSDEMDEIESRICEALGIENKVVEVEKLVEAPDSERVKLQIELDTYKSLYTDLVKQITDARFERQVIVEEKVGVSVEPVIEETPQIEVDVEDLAKKMSTPNDEMAEKKMGRLKGNKNKSTEAEPIRTGKVNINIADWKTIREVTGMNEKTAKNIERYRNKHGDFVDLTDLLFVPHFASGCMNKYGQMLEV